MIYRIEKYNKKRNCWITIYSSSNFDDVNEYVDEYLANHRRVLIRLNLLLKKHLEE